MIPFGPFRPDAAGLNTPVVIEASGVLASVTGFVPIKGPVAVSEALADRCAGATTILKSDGSNDAFAGTRSKLYRRSGTTWSDVSRLAGGDYAVAIGEQWRFEVFGNLLLAVNGGDDAQKFDLVGGTNFVALGGSPPRARYIAIVRDFVLLGGIIGNERRVQWSALNNAEQYTPGANSADYQDFPSGGPVRGIVGGEVGYVFQAEKVTRMVFNPGSSEIFQFDEVEGGRGLVAPGSLIKLGAEAYYLAADGFYRFDLRSGASQPLGTGKWQKWFLGDLRAGTESSVLSGMLPRDRVIVWAYISRSNPTTTPDRLVLYDWVLDEATSADVSVESMSSWLSAGYTLDGMSAFGTLDTLPYSLDSSFWKGGAPLLGLFGTDHRLAHLEGNNLPVSITTADGQSETRVTVTGTRPQIDTTSAMVAVAARERDGDPITFEPAEAMEDTGEIGAWVSGNLVRARITVPAAAIWSSLKGIETSVAGGGTR